MHSSQDGIERRVLLWLDRDREFARLIPALDASLLTRGIAPLRHEADSQDGQLQLKLELLRRDSDGAARTIVYLPGYSDDTISPRPDGVVPELWSVYEYRFKGCVWGRGAHKQAGDLPEAFTLYAWLKSHGVAISDLATQRTLSKGGCDALLARYAERMLSTPVADWPKPLTLRDVETALGGDPRDGLLGLLRSPSNELRSWGDERTTVLARMEAEFGLNLPDAGDSDAEPLADEVAIQLALTEAWDAFGRPDDFPYFSRLPQKTEQRNKQTALVRDSILNNIDLGKRFMARMRRLEAKHQLASWASNHAGQPAALPLLAEARWSEFFDSLKNAAKLGGAATREFLQGKEALITLGASVPWESAGVDVQWNTALDLLELVSDCQTATDKLDTVSSMSELVQNFTASWWRLDNLHLRLLADSKEGHLQVVRDAAGDAYFDWASKLADHFCELFEESGEWPPAGLTSVQGLHHELWDHGSGRRGVIITDAAPVWPGTRPAGSARPG